MKTTLTPDQQRTATKNEIRKAFDGVYARLADLKFRWMDERGFEDFKDYKELTSKIWGAHDIKVVKMSKHFTMEVTKDGVRAQIKISTRRADIGFFKA